MKRNDLLSAILDAILACLMAIAGAGCLATAFSLEADMTAVALTAAVSAALISAFVRLRRGWVLLLLTALAGALLLPWPELKSSLFALLHEISTLYHWAYGWEIPEALLEYEPSDVTLVLQTVAACTAALAGFSLAKRLHPLAVLAVLLPVFPCIVVTDTVPSDGYLLLAILTVSLLVLTHHARQVSARQANRLTALLLIPVVLAGTLLFVKNPRTAYRQPNVEKGLFSVIEKLGSYLPFMNENPGGGNIPSYQAAYTVQLESAGSRDQDFMKVLEIVVSQTGPLYLRGRSYAGYTGLSWKAWQGSETLTSPKSDYLAERSQTIQIVNLLAQNAQHFPYYPGKALTLVDGAVESGGQESALYSFRPLQEGWNLIWLRKNGTVTVKTASFAGLEQYLELPEETTQRALPHLWEAGVTDGLSIVQTAQRIGEYVENIAEYSLNTGRMPEDETDFALWFLDSGSTGYCVHFASAATVLLRAAGIPARYVEGYLVDAEAGQTTAVRGSNAHAWTEYYVPDVGWVILEATPGEGLPIQLPTEPTGPTDPTDPTEPTEPSNPTEPSDPTVPTGPSDPTEPTAPTLPPKPTDPTGPSGTTQPTQPTGPTEPVQTTGPAATEPTPEPPAPRDFTWLKELLRFAAVALAILAAVIGQWKLRLTLRRKAMAGNAWAALRRRWRYTCLLARLCCHRPPKALLELMKKAKFSQHALSDRELRRFDRYCDACIHGLKGHPWPLRALYRLVLAAW